MPVDDLGNVAILPGLVNAHTHLEFSDLPEPIGTPGMPFVDWIRLVIDHFRQGQQTSPQTIRRGLQESFRAGTTTLGEIAQPGWSSEPFEDAGLDTTVFLELIAPTADRIPPLLELAPRHVRSRSSAGPCAEGDSPIFASRKWGQSPSRSLTQEGDSPIFAARKSGQSPSGSTSTWHPGLGPHAPYSVLPELFNAAVSLSAASRVPMAFHLAESREELELLRSGGGPFRQRFEELGTCDPALFIPGRRPLDYLRQLAEAHRALVIHGNYLDDEEIAFLAERAERMAVVYCPRTHAFFQHDLYPLEQMLAAGAVVALGTDSRASSPDLSVLAEMRTVAKRHPDVAGDVVLQLGTLNAARALGRAAEIGSLEPGKHANLAVVALPPHDAADPHQLLLDGNEPVVATWYRGSPVSGSADPPTM